MPEHDAPAGLGDATDQLPKAPFAAPPALFVAWIEPPPAPEFAAIRPSSVSGIVLPPSVTSSACSAPGVDVP
ncbi:MAG: hypothetical protein WDN30_04690 [Pararobbsia sp.]